MPFANDIFQIGCLNSCRQVNAFLKVPPTLTRRAASLQIPYGLFNTWKKNEERIRIGNNFAGQKKGLMIDVETSSPSLNAVKQAAKVAKKMMWQFSHFPVIGLLTFDASERHSVTFFRRQY